MVTRNFPPLTGGMERLNHHVFLALSESFDVALCGPEGSHNLIGDAPCWEFPASPAWRYVGGSLIAAVKAARAWQPDLIYAGSGLAAHAANVAAWVAHAPLLVFLHGLDIVAKNTIYQRIFLPAIRSCDAFLVNSANTAQLAKRNGIAEERIRVVHPGVALPDFSVLDARRAEFRRQFQLGNRHVLLSVGRLTQRKGIVEFLEHCLPGIIQTYPEVCLLIIGDAPMKGLGTNAVNIVGQIEEVIDRHGLHQHVRMLGAVDDATLSDAYFASDLLIFPVRELAGDVEGFGMVAVEAASHGLFTIGFASGGVSDAVAEGQSGNLAASGDYAHLTNLILNQMSNATLERQTACRQHAEQFTWDHFGEKIRARCSMLLSHHGGAV